MQSRLDASSLTSSHVSIEAQKIPTGYFVEFRGPVTEKSQVRTESGAWVSERPDNGMLSGVDQHTRAARAEHRRGGEGSSPMVLCSEVRLRG